MCVSVHGDSNTCRPSRSLLNFISSDPSHPSGGNDNIYVWANSHPTCHLTLRLWLQNGHQNHHHHHQQHHYHHQHQHEQTEQQQPQQQAVADLIDLDLDIVAQVRCCTNMQLLFSVIVHRCAIVGWKMYHPDGHLTTPINCPVSIFTPPL